MSSARTNLTRFAWLSIAAAIATIALKFGAYVLTGSVGLLSDAAESIVNLVAAFVALLALHVAARPLENVGVGLGISVAASALNGIVAMTLLRAGRQHNSITLVADGKHLLTDVWTSVGVVVGVLLVALTKWERLDSIIAFLVGCNIVWTGWHLMRESVDGLMDKALDAERATAMRAVLDRYSGDEVTYHHLRTREAGHRIFASVHVLVPGAWTVQRGHDLVEDVEADLRTAIPQLDISIHLEPREDPRSYESGLQRPPTVAS